MRIDISQLITKPKRDPNALFMDMRDDNEPLLFPRNSNVSSMYRDILSSRSPLQNPKMQPESQMAAASDSIARAKRGERGHP